MRLSRSLTSSRQRTGRSGLTTARQNHQPSTVGSRFIAFNSTHEAPSRNHDQLRSSFPLPKPWLVGFASFALLVAQTQAQSGIRSWLDQNFPRRRTDRPRHQGQIKLRGSFNATGSNPDAGVYDDGYVPPDGGTATDGLTSFWGYQNGSLYNAGSQTLQMNSASSFTADGSSKLDQQFPVGVELAYGNKLRSWGRTSLGWEFGFGYLPISLKV